MPGDQGECCGGEGEGGGGLVVDGGGGKVVDVDFEMGVLGYGVCHGG